MFPNSLQPTNININFNFNGADGIGGANDIISELKAILNPGLNSSNDVFGGNFFNSNTTAANDPAPVASPSIIEGDQPTGSLKTDGNKVTTAGGYTIEQTAQYNWKITGPDGKETKIEGDPHVLEGDGGKFDFHKNSTFVLGDGTKINVTTVPYSGNNGNTVTGKLEIISGNDRVEVNDIDKGLGKVGTVTQDGYAHANSFQGQVFVQGRETDDWSMNGKEIVGNESGDDNFKLGGELEAGRPTTGGVNNTGSTNNSGNTRGIEQMFDRFLNNRNWMMSALRDIFSSAFAPQNRLGSNPYSGNTTPPWQSGQHYDRSQHRSNMTNAFRNMSQMFDILARMSNMSDHLSAMRQRAQMFTPSSRIG